MKKISLLVFPLAFAGCAHGLPQKDVHPQEAKSHGYYVSSTEATERGSNGNYVPRICSNGGWGQPASHCDQPEKAAAPAVKDEITQTAAAPAQPPARPLAPLRVYFETDQSQLSASESSRVRAWLHELEANSGSKPTVVISGYADPRGTTEHNLKLSRARAQSVAKLLKSSGLPSERLQAEGKGELNGGKAPEENQRARRAEIQIQ